MSRHLQASLIFLCIMAGAYFTFASAHELWDLIWKINHQ